MPGDEHFPADAVGGGRPQREDRPRQSSSRGRVPPHNIEAEESVLGALLLSREAIGAVSEMGLAPADFYKPAHRHIYDAVRSLYSSGAPADTVTVADELRRAGLLAEVGGAETLHELQNTTPSISSAGHYARIVQETALLRQLIFAAGDIAELAYSEPDDVIKALDLAESKVFNVAEQRVTDSTRNIEDLLPELMDHLEETFSRGDIITGVPTGYTDLDELLSGLQSSALYIVGARPAMGKTAFGLGIAAHVAMHTTRPVLVFSLEMAHQELTQRILASEARVDSTKLRTGKLADTDWSKIGKAIGRLEVPLFLDDNPRVTVMEIRAKARRIKARYGGLGLIVIDYLQLMGGNGYAENRQLEVSEISRNLKILARELEVPIVALSQLSRNLEARADKRPMLSDLRESGCLTAGTRLVRADTNMEVTLGDLVESGETDIPVWSLDERYRLVPANLSAAFPSGVKDTFRLRLASGRYVDASANHPFLTLDGWQRVEDLAVGNRIASARRIPAAPETAPPMSEAELVLLGHLMGDGCTLDRHAIQYTTTDPANVDAKLTLLVDRVSALHSNPNVDVIPAEVWNHVRHKSMPSAGITCRELAIGLGMQYCGSTLYKSGVSRSRMQRLADVTGDPWLSDLATSDVMWDEIVAIDAVGPQPVFDATIDVTHNFVANGIIAHNSLEQDADVVMFLYRDEVYHPDSPDKGSAEVIVAKHRSGPIGTKRLVFLGQYTRFDNAARGV
jgi:replicative DNA helicase